MSLPSTQKQWVIESSEKAFDGLVYQENAALPTVGTTEVLVRLRGAALNYRDLIIPKVKRKRYWRGLKPPITLSPF